MSVGTTIKKLRRERNITQEKLAEWLGVSANAVSQWECDKTAPDISLLPMLAEIFEVSADVLLEIDIAKSRKKSEILAFTDAYAKLHSQGKTAERLALCRTMQSKYPNDETVLYFLMRVLQNGYIAESFEEIIMLGEQLLESSNTEYRLGAIRGLCFTYLHIGDRQQALRYADMMPPTEDLYVHVLEGTELVRHCQNFIWKNCDRLYVYMKYLLDSAEAGYTPAEKHSAWETLYDIFHKIFPDQDFGFWHDRLARICFFMALESAREENFENALRELEQMLFHLEQNRQFNGISHTSPLVNTVTVTNENIARSSEETIGKTYLRYLQNHTNLFMPVHASARYQHIQKQLAAL